jgi:hypothetical protein
MKILCLSANAPLRFVSPRVSGSSAETARAEVARHLEEVIQFLVGDRVQVVDLQDVYRHSGLFRICRSSFGCRTAPPARPDLGFCSGVGAAGRGAFGLRTPPPREPSVEEVLDRLGAQLRGADADPTLVSADRRPRCCCPCRGCAAR